MDQPAAQPTVAGVPEHTILYNNITIARVNPLGLFNGLSFGYRKRLVDRPDSKLFRDSFFGISLGPNLSPAIAQFGPLIEIQPLAIFKLSANYLFTGYFGTFEYFQSFKDPNSNYSDSLQDNRKDAGENYPNYSHQFELKALLQAKVGPVAVRSTVLGYYNSTRVTDPTHTTWYSVKYDMLMPKQGWMVGNESDLIYVSKFGLVAGVRYNLNHVVKYPGFEGVNPNSPQQRLGPLLAYTFYDKPQKRFNKPTLIVLAQWWLTHRYRTGLETSQALPWIVIAFAFSGELWTSDDTKKKSKRQAMRRAPRLPI
ncbi:MAG: hypothetical protein KC468_04455 [Myxococcales bacterium]|nr:hypothetical protein [Myxococcales bacterium]